MLKVKKITPIKSVFNFQDLHVECGILENRQHYQPQQNKTRKLGTSIVRRQSNIKSKEDIVAICDKMDKKFGILSKPKQLHSQRIVDKIIQELIGEWLYNKKRGNAVLNGWRAFFRQPMMSGEYKNTNKTALNKGFNKGSIDTGQFYNAIESVIICDNKQYGLK